MMKIGIYNRSLGVSIIINIFEVYIPIFCHDIDSTKNMSKLTLKFISVCTVRSFWVIVFVSMPDYFSNGLLGFAQFLR